MRILIAADCFADAEAAIRLLDRFPTGFPSELGGLLMDDDVLANIGHWAEQRVVTSAGLLIRPPSEQQARALRESDARAFRQRLGAIAHARSVKWSFERGTGDLMRGVFEVAQAWDLLLLGHRGLHRRPGQVVLLSSDPDAAGKADQLAQELGEVLNTSLLALRLPAVTDQDDPADAVSIAVETERKLLSHLSRINACVVVADLSAGPFRTEDQLRQVLDAARCPVVVLGAKTRHQPVAFSMTAPPSAQ